jgi:hypothetical protein
MESHNRTCGVDLNDATQNRTLWICVCRLGVCASDRGTITGTIADPADAVVPNPSPGQWGTAAAYYSDFRYQRRPVENLSLGRVFRIKERATLQVRAEFTNIFNRTEMSNPTATNPLATPSLNGLGQYTAGFGYINLGTTFSAPRQGQLIARFQF